MRKGRPAAQKRTAGYLWSRLVLHLADGRCECCGKPATDAAHVLAKSVHPSVRFLLLNGVALDRACHERLRSARIVGPSEMREFFVEKRGRVLWSLLLSWAAEPGPNPSDQRDTLLMMAKARRIR